MNTPKIRFKGYTDAWEQRKFGDVGSVSMCKRIFKDETTDEGDIPFFKIGTFGGVPDAYISRKLFEDYKAKYPYPTKGDILLSASGTIGRMLEYNGEEAYFQDSNIVWLSHDQSIDNRFLKVLYGIVKWDGIEGSTIQRLYNDNFLKTKFQMPSKEEQEKIGGYFANLDNLITLHQHKCDSLNAVKKCMLQKMFPQNGAKVPEIRFKGFTGDWEQRKFKDNLISIQTGTNLLGAETNEGMPLLKMGNIQRGYFDTSKLEYLSDFNSIEPENIANYGDFFFNTRNTLELVGKGATWMGESGKYAFNSNIARFKLDGIDTIFFNYLYNTESMTKQIHARAMGTTSVAAIYPRTLDTVEYYLPSDEEQKQIGMYFKNLDNLITLHQRKADSLKELKKFMLQNMFP